MVKGMNFFKEYFSEYTDQYVIIGGAACDISFGDIGLNFRSTRDLDMVLIIEAQTKEFGERFWGFIKDGKYRNKIKSDGKPQFYRFDKPENREFPSMIELFAKDESIIENSTIVPIHIDDSVSSLSAILLDKDYYKILLDNRDVIDGISILKPIGLLLFKIKAYLDLIDKKSRGIRLDGRNIKKHKNDIIRLAVEFTYSPIKVSESIKTDVTYFLDEFYVSSEELKNLKIKNVDLEEIKSVIRNVIE
jgi:hypothetical protein